MRFLPVALLLAGCSTPSGPGKARFDAYCAAHDRTVFDKDTVEGWVGVQLQRCGRYRSWMSYIRDLGRWMTMTGIPDAYVLSDRWKAPIVAAHPYLLSRHEIDLFFAAAAGTAVATRSTTTMPATAETP